MKAQLLGLHESNGNVSIDGYFEYCRRELPRFLTGWNYQAARPGDSAPVNGSDRNKNWVRFENYVAWPLRLASFRADVFHIVDQNIAWYMPFLSGGHKIVTIHDLIKVMVIRKHLALAEVPRAQAAKIKFCVEQMQKASALVCVSQNTADCAMRELGVPASKLHVVYQTMPADFSPVSAEERKAERARVFGDADVALLHVGKPSIYKNREGVLQIFEKVKKRYPRCRLAITNTELLSDEIAVLEDKDSAASISVHRPRTRSELRLLYGAADVFLFPSLYEGFGLPPIEAMSCGCPVVCSPNCSLAEVVGESAITIADARDYNAFAEAVCRLIEDGSAAAQLVRNGFKNASRFSVDTITPQLAAVYSSVC